MAKALRIGISIVLVAAVLAACGGPEPEGVAGPDGGQAVEESPSSVLARVTGLVTAAESGLPLRKGSASLPGYGTVPVEQGRFVFEGVAPGSYAVEVSAPYHRTRTVEVHVDGRDVTVNVALPTVFSERELYDLAAIVRAEAEGEPHVGRVAVAASILNRWRSPAYPDNLSEIIYQVVDGRYQYSPVLDGRIALGPNAASWRAVYEALSGVDPSGGATGFFAHAKVGARSWVRRWPVTARIANHTFFRYP